MERDGNDLNASTTPNRDGGDGGAGSAGSTSGGAGSTGGYGAGTSNTGGAGLGGSTGLGGASNTGSGSAGYGTGGAGQSNYGSTGATQSAAGAGLGLGGASEGGASEGGTGEGGASRIDGLKGTAQERAGQAREKLGEAGAKARGMKSKLEQTLADRLESGANRLRERGTGAGAGAGTSGMTPAYATGGSADAAAGDRLAGRSADVAKGMEATADWLRNGDLKGTIETQARTNPGRTLLVALGVGYLLGKAIRR